MLYSVFYFVELPAAARSKTYLGYSDAGFLLAGLHKAGLEVAWGPMPQDAVRGDHGLDDGTAAINRALDWLVRRDPAAARSGVDAVGRGVGAACGHVVLLLAGGGAGRCRDAAGRRASRPEGTAG